DGTYYLEDEVEIESLPNSKGYIPLGSGKFIHSLDGFKLVGYDSELELVKDPLSLYSLHIEYDYLGKGDCFDLSTIDDTYYIYPKTKKDVVTKLHFAVEEMYKINKEKLRNKINK
ncbi:MAG: hypothetical protein WC006_00360, partial [Bacilli bacterium]